MYILFEGIDTCGKSTQIALLKETHPEIVVTKEPGGTPFGVKAREILLNEGLRSERAEILLFLADRAEHYECIVKSNRDRVVVSDRGFVSGIAYAMAHGGYDFDELVRLNRFALEGNFPDRIVLFLTDEATLRERLGQKAADGIEARGIAYLLDVQARMRDIVTRLEIPHLFVDATDTIENIHKALLRYLKL